MSDKSKSDEIGVLDPEWDRAWYQLRSDGFSDSDIWDMVRSVDDATWLEDPPPGKEKQHYFVLLISKIIELRECVYNNEDRPPLEWIEAGILVSILCSSAWENEQARENFFKRQWAISLGPRNRTSLAKRAIEYILREAPGGSPANQERGLNLERFRHFVGESCRITVNGTTIEITAIEDDDDKKIIGYVFEDRDLPASKDTKMTPISTIRGIVARLNKQPPIK